MTPLEDLLDTLDRAVPPDDPPFLVEAYGHAHEGGVLITDENDSKLLGWRVPDDCWAVGVVGQGWALPYPNWRGTTHGFPANPPDPFPLDADDFPLGSDDFPLGSDDFPPAWALTDDGGGGGPSGDRFAGEGVDGGGGGGGGGGGDGDGGGRMRLCCLVGRDGQVASLLRAPDGSVVASGEAEGRAVDALRRALGLATPPPERDAADLLAVLWINDLIGAVDAGIALGWPEAAALHPAMRALAAEGHDLGLEHMTLVARVASAAWSWENLRIQACQEDWLADMVSAELARWMDEGMFSRWMLADLPPLPVAISAVADHFDPSVWREVTTVIAATGADPGDGFRARRGECRRPATPGPGRQPRARPRN